MDGNDATILCRGRKLTPGDTVFQSSSLQNNSSTCLVSENPTIMKHETIFIFLMGASAKFQELTAMLTSIL
jgi:hypothetical protein